MSTGLRPILLLTLLRQHTLIPPPILPTQILIPYPRMLKHIRVYPRIGKDRPEYVRELLSILRQHVTRDKTLKVLDEIMRITESITTLGEDKTPRWASPSPTGSDEGTQ